MEKKAFALLTKAWVLQQQTSISLNDEWFSPFDSFFWTLPCHWNLSLLESIQVLYFALMSDFFLI